VLELETLEAFDAHLSSHNSLAGVACQGLDLTDRSWPLMQADVRGAFFLGCRIEPSALDHLIGHGACVFPALDGLPFRAFRSTLYTAAELYEGYVPGDHESYERTPDARSYRWHRETVDDYEVVRTLAERIHDHAIDDALRALLRHVGEREVVAVMGGHGLARTDATYREVAELGRALTRAGFYVATGGGPGAMEAANLGAWLAPHPDGALDEALDVLSAAASYSPAGPWLDTAFAVRERWPAPSDAPSSLGVPTWHYGHEPPNVFAGEIAKYFANSIREDGLLAIALAGVVFAPGSAGTIQEVFQDAAQNHYESFGIVSPMVFLDEVYWTERKPVYPLLRDLATGYSYGELVTAVDDAAAAVEFIVAARRAPAGDDRAE